MIQIRYFCDRCGEEVNERDTVTFTVNPRRETRDLRWYFSDTICAQCALSFQEWLDAGRGDPS